MTVYIIADVEVTDEAWIPEYAEKVHDIVHRHGGKYLSRSANIEVLEGEPLSNTLIAVMEFPNAERQRRLQAIPIMRHMAVLGRRVPTAVFN